MIVDFESTKSPTRLLTIPPKTGSSHFEALFVDAPTELSPKVMLGRTTGFASAFAVVLVGLFGVKLGAMLKI